MVNSGTCLLYPFYTHSLYSRLSQVEPGSPDPLEESCDNSPTYPRYESRWMSAEILALAADNIDTLLEDWYPGLGARDGNKTAELIPYVNRVIPCPFCVSKAKYLEVEDSTQVRHVPNVWCDKIPYSGKFSWG